MDRFSASLIEGRIRFGKYPTDEEVALLKQNGYIIFLDLCPQEEITWPPYSKEGLYYNSIPIADRTPDVKDLSSFREFLKKLVEVISSGYLVYIHCRGGHGRSAMVAAILYGRITGLEPIECLQAVNEAHKLRTEVKSKFRKMGAPQTASQKRFVMSELGSV